MDGSCQTNCTEYGGAFLCVNGSQCMTSTICGEDGETCICPENKIACFDGTCQDICSDSADKIQNGDSKGIIFSVCSFNNLIS